MKRLIVATMLCTLCAVALEAAQCEGLTLAGERCKREAAENSKYCIGHADQAKAKEKVAKAKDKTKAKVKAVTQRLKDDGTCWAMADNGERCKLQKDGESDYCKTHAASKKPSEPVKQCRALTWDGTQCERAPQQNCYYCKQHAMLGAAKAAIAAKTSASPKAGAKAKSKASKKQQ